MIPEPRQNRTPQLQKKEKQSKDGRPGTLKNAAELNESLERKRKRGKSVSSTKVDKSICQVCSTACEENSDKTSIECVNCKFWYHGNCVLLTDREIGIFDLAPLNYHCLFCQLGKVCNKTFLEKVQDIIQKKGIARKEENNPPVQPREATSAEANSSAGSAANTSHEHVITAESEHLEEEVERSIPIDLNISRSEVPEAHNIENSQDYGDENRSAEQVPSSDNNGGLVRVENKLNLSL